MTSDDAALPADGADVGAEVSDPDGRPVRIRFSIPAGKGLPDRIVTIAMSAAEAARVAILLSRRHDTRTTRTRTLAGCGVSDDLCDCDLFGGQTGGGLIR